MNTDLYSNQPLYMIYPEEDGSAIAENTRQWRWIVTIAGGLQTVFAERPDVFVAGNLLWYPVEGRSQIRTAPDALVAFGRPKGDRGSYLQWLENDIAPQVVFEVLSPGNRYAEMVRKFQFYERYGVEEYYLYDPEDNRLEGWRRIDDRLVEIDSIDGWVSPRLQLRFVLGVEALEMYQLDGRRIATFDELVAEQGRLMREAAEAQRQAAEAQRQVAEAQRQAAEAQRQAAEAQREVKQAQREATQAQQDVERAQREAIQAQREIERLQARLRALGVNPESEAS